MDCTTGAEPVLRLEFPAAIFEDLASYDAALAADRAELDRRVKEGGWSASATREAGAAVALLLRRHLRTMVARRADPGSILNDAIAVAKLFVPLNVMHYDCAHELREVRNLMKRAGYPRAQIKAVHDCMGDTWNAAIYGEDSDSDDNDDGA